MRSKRASAPCTSTCTLSIWPSGKKSRLWSVVKATMSPTVGASGAPDAACPASQYTSAGVMLKTVPTIMKNQRPTMLWRICRTRQPRVDLAEAVDVAACCWPNVLVSSMPLTLSVSSVMADMSARLSCVVGADACAGPCPTR